MSPASTSAEPSSAWRSPISPAPSWPRHRSRPTPAAAKRWSTQIAALAARLARRAGDRAATGSGWSSSARRACSMPRRGRSGSRRTSPISTGSMSSACSSDAFGVDIIIENDVNVGALGERWLGRARGVETFAYIALGTGLGMGIVADGKIIRGAHGGAGEIANLPIGGDPLDPVSRVHGTLEARGRLGRHRRALCCRRRRPRRRASAISSSASTTTPRARAAIDETARLMALAVVAVVATIDPEMVVLGGSIGAQARVRRRVRGAPRAACSPSPPPVEASALGNRSGIAGALAIGINNIHNSLFAPTFASTGLSLPAIDELAGLGVAP